LRCFFFYIFFFFFQAEDGIRDRTVTGVQTCALPISARGPRSIKVYSGSEIRNVAVAGHNDTGKTTLVSQLLFTAGATSRFGRIRSQERRVGKEWRSRRGGEREKEKG